ncbi:MAG: PhzF family phenazine biosynthesis protein [Candidatus Hydrogenedentes bacterium]|nr:PhzF family phenazine biosynthesis protein [Candidatus Hydrogenedentota bacterium]
MSYPLYQVDAFTSEHFQGNPAAVCLLDQWLPDETLQTIAAENNLAETAFTVLSEASLRLRWFTPAVEVDLCGHATLATAWVFFERLAFSKPSIAFNTRSGPVSVSRDGDRLFLDFPSRPPVACEVESGLIAGLNVEPQAVLAARDYFCVFNSAEEIRALEPDFAALAKLNRFAVIATAPGEDCDYVSRFFAPAQGIDEDPATGSAQCTLIPYWAQRLKKTTLAARQLSARGATFTGVDRGDRVSIGGQCRLYLEGKIWI